MSILGGTFVLSTLEIIFTANVSLDPKTEPAPPERLKAHVRSPASSINIAIATLVAKHCNIYINELWSFGGCVNTPGYFLGLEIYGINSALTLRADANWMDERRRGR